MNNLISTKEASEILGISPATVTQYIIMGYIKASKIGNSYVIQRSDIEDRKKRLEQKRTKA
jgi:excisionase family DNA binding protein